MRKFTDRDYIIIVQGEKTRFPNLAVYRNGNLIATYTEKFGAEVLSGTCDEISEAMRMIPEYFPNKVVGLL